MFVFWGLITLIFSMSFQFFRYMVFFGAVGQTYADTLRHPSQFTWIHRMNMVSVVPVTLIVVVITSLILVITTKAFSELTTADFEWIATGSACLYEVLFVLWTDKVQNATGVNLRLLEMVMNYVLTLLVLGASFGGFYLFDTTKAVIWLLFWVWAWPVMLVFTRPDAFPLFGKGEFLKIYQIGVSQIPIVGKLLESLLAGLFRRNEVSPSDKKEGS